MNKTGEAFSSKGWSAENVRLSAFPSPAASFENPNWWETVVGEAPDSRMSQPKVGVLQEQGQFNSGNLVLTIRPGRIDWLLNALEPGGVIAPFEDMLGAFDTLARQWVLIAPPLQRIAFGAVLHFPVNDRAEGYEILGRFLHHVKLDPKGSSEFLYQINRPRASSTGIDNLVINRLSKWTVGTTQKATYTLVPGVPDPTQMTNVEQESYARVEFDINTSAEFNGDLPSDKLYRIFEELTVLAREIAEKGDIP